MAKADGGKFFILDESGQPVLVIMGVDEYEKVLLRRVENQVADIDEANRLIMEAANREQSHLQEQEMLKSEVIDSTFDFEDLAHRIETSV